MDFGVTRRASLLVGAGEFLMELLPWPNPAEFDRDIFARPQAASADHFAGEIQDLDRLAHIENEDFAPLSDRARPA